MVVYSSVTDIAMHLRPLVLITYICGFIRDRSMIECNKDQWIDQKNHNVFQWAINVQNIIRHYNELKLIYLIR